jgi:hypothetical protein
LVPLVFAGGLGIAHSTQFTEAATPGRLSCVWTFFPHIDRLARQGGLIHQEACMGEFDFDVVSDLSDPGPRPRPFVGVKPAPQPEPRPAAPREIGRVKGDKNTAS